MAAPEFGELCQLVFARYPHWEWASFARFGWRETRDGMVVTLAAVEAPGSGDLNETVGHVMINEPYTLRVALAAETHPLSVGIIHSHPKDCAPRPSSIDDDMDNYYGRYFQDFAPGRPYVSLIASQVNGELELSGRIYWRGTWLLVSHFAIERTPTRTWTRNSELRCEKSRERTARLNAAFGEQAAHRLRRSSVAVIGAGGTGSAAIESLARAGVGKIVVVDPDHVDTSNLERIHGSKPEHAEQRVPKAQVARDHVLGIDPSCRVVALRGALPQKDVVDIVASCDLALGCTDQQHSRLALSDLAVRYLVPALDCGVVLEGQNGRITGQVLQIVRFLANDSCALCRDLVTPQRLSQELMSSEERDQRRIAAKSAEERGESGNPYWLETAQLNTVGYLTTIAGAMMAGYAIGWLTGRFDAPFERLQLDLTAKLLGVVDPEDTPRTQCVCRRVRGWADQASADALIAPPSHWPNVEAL